MGNLGKDFALIFGLIPYIKHKICYTNLIAILFDFKLQRIKSKPCMYEVRLLAFLW